MAYDGLLHYSSQNWRDRDGTEVSVLLGLSDFRYWNDGGFLPLLWNGGGCEREVEQPIYWLAEDRRPKSEQPCGESIKPSGVVFEFV